MSRTSGDQVGVPVGAALVAAESRRPACSDGPSRSGGSTFESALEQRRRALQVAVFDDQPAAAAAGAGPPRRSRSRSASSPSGPEIERRVRFESAHAALDARVIVCNVRRIADDQCEVFVRARLHTTSPGETPCSRVRAARRCWRQSRPPPAKCPCRSTCRRGRSWAIASAIAPLPDARSRTRPGASRGSRASASSTASSVSGRGISTSGVTSSGNDQNSFSRRM